MQEKIIKLFLFSIFFCFFLIFYPAKSAWAGIVMTEGEFIVLGSDPSPEDYINQRMFQEMTLEINNEGKVKGLANFEFSDLDWKGAFFSGNATLSLEGNYDTKENKLSGNFSVNHTTSMKNEKEPPLVSFYNNDSMTFNGTVSGGWSNKNSSFEIFFEGTKRSIGKIENSNGMNNDYDSSTKWNNKAVFIEDLCDSLIAKIEKDTRWKFIQTAQAKDSGARFTAFSGEVLVAPKGNQNDEQPAEDNMILEEGDLITTGGDSCAIISYADMSTFIMKARSKVILDSAPEKQSKLKLIAGNIWVNLEHIYETGHLDVTMNQAIAGTKGTTFIASEDGTNSIIKVLEGLMSYKSLKTNEEIDVGPGEMASTNIDGKIEKTIFDTEIESLSWKKIQTNLTIVRTKTINEEPAKELIVTNKTESKPSPEVEKNNFKGILIIIIISIVIIGFWKIKLTKKQDR